MARQEPSLALLLQTKRKINDENRNDKEYFIVLLTYCRPTI